MIGKVRLMKRKFLFRKLSVAIAMLGQPDLILLVSSIRLFHKN